MGEDRVPQRGVGHTADHRRLDGGHQLACLGPERGEAENLVTVRGEEHLDEPARLRQGPGPKDSGHGQGEQAVSGATASGLRFVAADPRQFGIEVHAVGHQAVPGGAAASRQVVVHHTEVVEGNMGELRAAGALTQGPDPGRRRGQALVHPDVAHRGPVHPGPLQPDAFGIWRAAGCDKQVGPFDSAFAVWSLRQHAYLAAGSSLDATDLCPEANSDSLIAEELKYRRTDVSVFVAAELLPLLDDGYARAEAAHGLRQLQANIAAAHDDQMLW